MKQAALAEFAPGNHHNALAWSETPDGLGFGKITQVDLVQQVVDQLRARILSGEIGSHGELPAEAQLGAIFGVSRTVAREAMRTLRAQGLVDVSRGRRPRVAAVDPQIAIDNLQVLLIRTVASPEHLLEFRRLLELEIAGLAAQRATNAELAELNSIIDKQSHATSHKQQLECDRRFHDALARATGNSLFPMMLSTIAPLLTSEARQCKPSRAGALRAKEGHVAILRALQNRNSQEARKAMAQHLETIQ